MRKFGLEYRYLVDFLERKITKKELLKKTETKIWHYAKRQRTWFKRDARINWFEISDFKNIQNLVSKFLK